VRIGVSGGERSPISEGAHTLRLVSCDLRQVKDRFSADENAVKEKFAWTLKDDVSNETYTVWTNTQYGHAKASLTAFLDMILPGVTMEQVANLSTDDLVGKMYRTRIVHKKNPTSGKVYAQHTFLEPVESGDSQPRSEKQSVSAPTAGPTAQPALVLGDPFANDEGE
jgi:hypothetical protein